MMDSNIAANNNFDEDESSNIMIIEEPIKEEVFVWNLLKC